MLRTLEESCDPTYQSCEPDPNECDPDSQCRPYDPIVDAGRQCNVDNCIVYADDGCISVPDPGDGQMP